MFTATKASKKFNKLLALLFLFILHYHSICYAMQQEESVEQQSVRSFVVQDMSHESFLPDTRERIQNCKQNWFVKNVIVDFPIIGDFFQDDPSCSDIIKRVVKSTSMLLGGSIGMMLDFVPISENNNMALKITKNSINMAIGMWGAAVIYNIVFSFGHVVHRSFSNSHEFNQNTLML